MELFCQPTSMSPVKKEVQDPRNKHDEAGNQDAVTLQLKENRLNRSGPTKAEMEKTEADRAWGDAPDVMPPRAVLR